MVQATDWNRVLVADLTAERARLGEANVVRFARRPAAYDAWLGCHIVAVLLVAQPDGFCSYAAATARRLLGQNDQGRRLRSIHCFRKSLSARRLDAVILCEF